jgi:hypothetical protein
MLSEMGLRLKSALDLPLLLRRSCAGETPTEAEIRELEIVARALRKQVNHLVDDELTSSMEAYCLATDGLELLRNQLVEKRCHRDEMRALLDETKSELDLLDRQYLEEMELREVNQHDIIRMKQNTETMRKDAINMRAEIKQMTYFQEVVDVETTHRLRVDVQNLELERERDSIILRQLNSDREKLRSELNQLEVEMDAVQRTKFERHQELAEARMTRDMYKVRQESLELHLQEGDSKNLFSSRVSSMMQLCRELLKGGAEVKEFLDEYNGKGASSQAQNAGMPFSDNWKQQYERVNLRRRSQSPSSPREVGKIVICADDDGAESSDLLALIPPFKMDDRSDINLQKVNRISSEIDEFPSESSSISVISALTADDDAWAKYN